MAEVDKAGGCLLRNYDILIDYFVLVKEKIRYVLSWFDVGWINAYIDSCPGGAPAFHGGEVDHVEMDEDRICVFFKNKEFVPLWFGILDPEKAPPMRLKELEEWKRFKNNFPDFEKHKKDAELKAPEWLASIGLLKEKKPKAPKPAEPKIKNYLAIVKRELIHSQFIAIGTAIFSLSGNETRVKFVEGYEWDAERIQKGFDSGTDRREFFDYLSEQGGQTASYSVPEEIKAPNIDTVLSLMWVRVLGERAQNYIYFMGKGEEEAATALGKFPKVKI